MEIVKYDIFNTVNARNKSGKYYEKSKYFLMFCIDYENRKQITAHCISLYWEGDLRNLSYFLNKRK